MDNNLKIYVVIPHYIVTEELKTLATNAINSFKRNSEVIVISVDDGSPMDVAFLKELSDVYLRNKENSGFGVTCNNGFKWIFENEPDDCYIICANNDIEINKKVVPALKEPFERWGNVAITGIVSSIKREFDGKPLEEVDLGRISEGGLILDRMQDGGLWMSKKSILQKIGLFDEQFIRGGYEDVDLFLRARDSFGMWIVMSGRAAYWHKQGATRWNCEKNSFINNFHLENKNIEVENWNRFRKKWNFNPHEKRLWFEREIFRL
jgi:GT2 family glycosyltransferase